METERIALSQPERDRLKVLHEVKQKQLTQVEAAKRLKVTDRHVRRMLLRVRERGDGCLVHGLRGRPSNRKLSVRLEQKILTRLRQRYADFGPTLAAEHLAQEGFSVSRETLRKWMNHESADGVASQLALSYCRVTGHCCGLRNRPGIRPRLSRRLGTRKPGAQRNS
jgi:transposase